ncbi:MAG: hypothetical protein ACKO1M_05960, partial [Planctomycetota bacterium]
TTPTTTVAADGAVTATLAAASATTAIARPRAGAQGEDGDGRHDARKNFANHANLQEEKNQEPRKSSRLFSNAPEPRPVEETRSLATAERFDRLLRWIGYVD